MGGQALTTHGRDPVFMSELNRLTPIQMALKVMSLLQEDWQRAWMREAIPFLAGAQWGEGLLDLKMGAFTADELEVLVDSVTESLDPIGSLRPERVVAFILVDNHQFHLDDLERIMVRLSNRFPEAKVEALCLNEAQAGNLQLVLAVGES
jgi:hypothetical protein